MNVIEHIQTFGIFWNGITTSVIGPVRCFRDSFSDRRYRFVGGGFRSSSYGIVQRSTSF